jgi:ABC-type Fe3+/spermidine/putrescine transport system ATPase subunit
MFLAIHHLCKSFDNNVILDNIQLTLNQGQTLSILGKSGCGKTTFLKTIAGLLRQDQGTIILEHNDISTQPPQQREAVYIYQQPLLFPHLSVYENIAFGLHLRKISPSVIREKTMAMLDDLELVAHAQKMPEVLSGGQRQRVSFGRALIIAPKLLLLDEPFGALDTETRTSMQVFFKKMAKQHQITAIFVTHDLKEAVLMGDNLALMERGQIHVYDHLEAFIQDSRTGMNQEIKFWKTLFRND